MRLYFALSDFWKEYTAIADRWNSSKKVDEMDKNQIYQKYKQCVLNAKQKIHYWEI